MIGTNAKGASESAKAKLYMGFGKFSRFARSASKARTEPKKVVPRIVFVPGRDGAPPNKLTIYDGSFPYRPRKPAPKRVFTYLDVPGGRIPIFPGRTPGGVHKHTKGREAEGSPAGSSHETGIKVEQAGKEKCFYAGASPGAPTWTVLDGVHKHTKVRETKSSPAGPSHGVHKHTKVRETKSSPAGRSHGVHKHTKGREAEGSPAGPSHGLIPSIPILLDPPEGNS